MQNENRLIVTEMAYAGKKISRIVIKNENIQ